MNWQKFSNEKKFSRFSGKDAHPCFIPFLKRLGKGFPCLFNPHAPDRFTPSRARCAKSCGAVQTHR